MTARIDNLPSAQEVAALPSLKVEVTLKNRITSIFLAVITLGIWIGVTHYSMLDCLKEGDIEGAKKWYRRDPTNTRYFEGVDGLSQMINERKYLPIKFMLDNNFSVSYTIHYTDRIPLSTSKSAEDAFLQLAIERRDDDLYDHVLKRPNPNSKLGSLLWNKHVRIVSEKTNGYQKRAESLQILRYLTEKNYRPSIVNFNANTWVLDQQQKLDADVNMYPLI